MDFWWKCIFSFLVALLFLLLNTSRGRLISRSRLPDLDAFWQRLVLNVFLFAMVKLAAAAWLPESPGFAFSQRFTGFMLNIGLILEACLCLLIAEGYMLLVKSQQMKTRNEALQQLNAEISYESLKNQVNPHFLFNSLSTISSMIDTDKAAAKQFLENMGQVYRYVLQSSKTPLVSFREELAFSMAWVNMMRERYHNRFRVETSVDVVSLSKQLPPMSLQLLVENIFKHNVLSSQSPLCIRISATGETLTVENDL
ncbi:MAG: sensor histidine kinase, partial [Pseudobacter sp.]|uniref:sensor histidine kinase n=1 Tax=Pseudobacter sp. TaxID=2045420 RepID=UPI003F813103